MVRQQCNLASEARIGGTPGTEKYKETAVSSSQKGGAGCDKANIAKCGLFVPPSCMNTCISDQPTPTSHSSLVMTTSVSLVFSHLLVPVRAGRFDAVLLVPPASTWSRAWHSKFDGQQPDRTRSRPYAPGGLSPEVSARIDIDKLHFELVAWFAAQAFSSHGWFFPEDSMAATSRRVQRLVGQCKSDFWKS